MKHSKVIIKRELNNNGVKCFQIKIITNKHEYDRIIPITDALNLDTEGNFNINCVPYITPSIHKPLYLPQGDRCRTCKGKYEINPPSCLSECPYVMKDSNGYICIATRHIKGNPNSLVILRGVLLWHLDNAITDLILRPSKRIGCCLHHLELDPLLDPLGRHKFADDRYHSKVHRELDNAEKYFYDMMSNKINNKTLIKEDENNSYCRLNEARNKLFKMYQKIELIRNSPNLAIIMSDYRRCIKKGELYLPDNFDYNL